LILAETRKACKVCSEVARRRTRGLGPPGAHGVALLTTTHHGGPVLDLGGDTGRTVDPPSRGVHVGPVPYVPGGAGCGTSPLLAPRMTRDVVPRMGALGSARDPRGRGR
jgi:hypothetical protein